MRKRFLILLTVFAFIFGLTACSKKDKNEDKEDQPTKETENGGGSENGGNSSDDDKGFDFHLVGNNYGWAEDLKYGVSKMTKTSVSELKEKEGLEAVVEKLEAKNDISYIYIKEDVMLGGEPASYKKQVRKSADDPEVLTLDGNVSFKVLRVQWAEDEDQEMVSSFGESDWFPGKTQKCEPLTDNFFLGAFREYKPESDEEDDHLGDWISDPLAYEGEGCYTLVYVKYANKAAAKGNTFGMALVKTGEFDGSKLPIPQGGGDDNTDPDVTEPVYTMSVAGGEAVTLTKTAAGYVSSEIALEAGQQLTFKADDTAITPTPKAGANNVDADLKVVKGGNVVVTLTKSGDTYEVHVSGNEGTPDPDPVLKYTITVGEQTYDLTKNPVTGDNLTAEYIATGLNLTAGDELVFKYGEEILSNVVYEKDEHNNVNAELKVVKDVTDGKLYFKQYEDNNKQWIVYLTGNEAAPDPTPTGFAVSVNGGTPQALTTNPTPGKGLSEEYLLADLNLKAGDILTFTLDGQAPTSILKDAGNDNNVDGELKVVKDVEAGKLYVKMYNGNEDDYFVWLTGNEDAKPAAAYTVKVNGTEYPMEKNGEKDEYMAHNVVLATGDTIEIYNAEGQKVDVSGKDNAANNVSTDLVVKEGGTLSVYYTVNDQNQKEIGIWVTTPEKEPNMITLYFKAGVWNTDGARIVLYITDDDSWHTMTDEDQDGIFEIQIDLNKVRKIIFVRMDGSKPDNNWDSKWNQTADLEGFDAEHNYAEIQANWDGYQDKPKLTFSKYTK